MKQFVLDQMKDYQHKKKIIKGIEYQEGMEDAWLVGYETYIDDNSYTVSNTVNKIFDSKNDVIEYITSSAKETKMDNFSRYTEPFPVLLREISKDEYEDNPMAITQNGQYFEYEELGEGYWIYIKNGIVFTTYNSEYFFDDYEPFCKEQNDARIGYDKELEELYVEMNCIRITIEETEVATVEKLLEGFEIPFIEKIGQAFCK